MKIVVRHMPIEAAGKRSSRNKRRQNSRQVTDRIVKTRSSNVYGYAYDLPEDSNIGTLYIQFKNAFGGPGDLYRYYEVPLKIYHKFISSPSKGHSFWKLIRDKYQYSKLTGDKIGKLKNAVNYG